MIKESITEKMTMQMKTMIRVPEAEMKEEKGENEGTKIRGTMIQD